VVSQFGWESLYARLYRFFTLAALVTFGGAYAVLAYVTQMATRSGWLTPTQVVDGLALAETTPGPLIMVLQFIGFVVGWNQSTGSSPLTSAVVAALLTTYATFLPSFLFIFVGAPYVEVLRGSRPLAAALSGVTAAVAGVVLSLAMSFALAVLWPHGVAGGVEWFALVLSVAAFIALQRLHIGVAWVILAGGLLGALRQ
jgi:chromate transporter